MKRSEFVISALTLLIPKKIFSFFEAFLYPKNKHQEMLDFYLMKDVQHPFDGDGGFLVPKSMHSDLLMIIDEMPPMNSMFPLLPPELHPNCRCDFVIPNPGGDPVREIVSQIAQEVDDAFMGRSRPKPTSTLEFYNEEADEWESESEDDEGSGLGFLWSR